MKQSKLFYALLILFVLLTSACKKNKTPDADFTCVLDEKGVVKITFHETPSDFLHWDFGDGTSYFTGNGSKNSSVLYHYYAQNGTYTITLKTENASNSKKTASSSQQITVTSVPTSFNIKKITLPSCSASGCIDEDATGPDVVFSISVYDGNSVNSPFYNNVLADIHNDVLSFPVSTNINTPFNIADFTGNVSLDFTSSDYDVSDGSYDYLSSCYLDFFQNYFPAGILNGGRHSFYESEKSEDTNYPTTISYPEGYFVNSSGDYLNLELSWQ